MELIRKLAVFTAVFTAVFMAFSVRGGDASGIGARGRAPGIAAPLALGSSCVSSDPSRICLGLKYVVYEDDKGVPVATASDALANLREINLLHGRCNIAFQIEQFEEVDPRQYDLAFNTANTSDLDAIREKFSDRSHLLIVTTGPWNRAGTLGATSANAWTAMPGSGPYGSILEAPVAKYSYIFAHELGHYLDLEHVDDANDLMNPVIYQKSRDLSRSQCDTERTLADGLWRDATRSY